VKLRRYAALVWKWLWLLALGALLGGGASYGVSRSLAPTYQASATLLVTQATTPAGPSYNDLLGAERLARTYAQVLTSRPVLLGAAATLQLPASYEQLQQLVSVEIVRDTQLLIVSAQHTDPEVAARLANAVAAEFIRQNEQSQLARLQSSRGSLDGQIQQLGQAIADKTAQLEAQRGQPASAERDARVAALQRELADLEQNYATLLRNADEIRLQQARAINSVSVVDPALPPERPARPNVPLNTLLGALLGLLLGSGAALLVEHLDDTLRTPARVEERLGLPTLGVVARFAHDASPAGALPVLDPATPRPDRQHAQRAQAAEAYRALRLSLRFSSLERPVRSLAVTSSMPSEGKTTTAANLAVALAQGGARVILVDADLRRPSLHRLFGLEQREGLTSLLLEADDSAVPPRLPLQPTSVPGLSLLASGPIPPNPSALLASARLQRVLDWLRAEASLVVLDSPPLLAVSDPLAVAACTDGVILVLDAERASSRAAASALLALQRAQAHVLGVVLNKLSPRAGGSYGAYYADYTRPDTPGPDQGAAPGVPTLAARADERG
jgi:capsular exopolysaccharide synthesis family protein